MAQPLLVTGAAGFIGMHVSRYLLEEGQAVVGIDNLNTYYDPKLKQQRLAQLATYPEFEFRKMDLVDSKALGELFSEFEFEYVIHLGAQAGVRYSLENPQAYIDSNMTGFLNILEGARHNSVKHLLYASSSSVYGNTDKTPCRETDEVNRPISLYAATKRSNELMAYTYNHLFGVPATGLRFFTVYGPWGRPDMAPFLFADAITSGRPIKVFNKGELWRDFTYIDDIVKGVIHALRRSNLQQDPLRVYNIGNHSPVYLKDFIHELEEALGKQAIREEYPMQPGDVVKTHADTQLLMTETGYEPSTPLRVGIREFADWFLRNHPDLC